MSDCVHGYCRSQRRDCFLCDRRDDFAMAALSAAIVRGYGNTPEQLAKLSVKHADALIVELDKE